MDEKTLNWIAIAVAGASGFLATQGLSAWLKWRSGSREDVAFQDGRITKGYDLALAAHAARIEVLEASLKAERAASEAHAQASRLREDECNRKASELSAKVAALEQEMKILKSDSWSRRNQGGKQEPSV